MQHLDPAPYPTLTENEINTNFVVFEALLQISNKDSINEFLNDHRKCAAILLNKNANIPAIIEKLTSLALTDQVNKMATALQIKQGGDEYNHHLLKLTIQTLKYREINTEDAQLFLYFATPLKKLAQSDLTLSIQFKQWIIKLNTFLEDRFEHAKSHVDYMQNCNDAFEKRQREKKEAEALLSNEKESSNYVASTLFFPSAAQRTQPQVATIFSDYTQAVQPNSQGNAGKPQTEVPVAEFAPMLDGEPVNQSQWDRIEAEELEQATQNSLADLAPNAPNTSATIIEELLAAEEDAPLDELASMYANTPRRR